VKPKTILHFLVLFAWPMACLGQRVIYVDASHSGAGDGSSWENAYACLQNALSEVRSSDVIKVAQGTYRPDRRYQTGRARPQLLVSGDRAASFRLRGGTLIKGGYAGFSLADPDVRDVNKYPTILSGALMGNDVELEGLAWSQISAFTSHPSRVDNSTTVVTGGGSNTVLDGLTITGGCIWSPPSGGFARVAMAGGSAMRNFGGTAKNCTFLQNTVQIEGTGFGRGLGIEGGAIVNVGSTPTFQDCAFIENICFTNSGGGLGGAVFNDGSHCTFTNCLFRGNVATASEDESAGGGGAICNHRSNPTLQNCTFVGNLGLRSKGGCLYNFVNSNPIIKDCVFTDNSSNYGGAIFCLSSSPQLTDCVFLRNRALNSGPGGAIASNSDSRPVLTGCVFKANSAYGGGALQNGWNCHPEMINCLFSGNEAVLGGSLYNTHAMPKLINCSFSKNRAQEKGGAIFGINSELEVANCIFWDNLPEPIHDENGSVSSLHSIIQGAWAGHGNIASNPLFVDADGPDDLAGTEDDNLHLLPNSPCIDAGSNSALPSALATDLDGNPRVENSIVDMGAYEGAAPRLRHIYHVSGFGGHDDQDGLSLATAFASIQRGIDVSADGDTILVHPGVYPQGIDFMGKSITVASAADAAILETPDADAVSFYNGEGTSSVLKNFVIRNSKRALFIVGSSPTLQNLSIVNNQYGITAYLAATPDISSCIFWGNSQADLLACHARYSCTSEPGEGNFEADPLFVDPNNGDFHLRSERGRYRASTDEWILDRVTSPCVDAGDPEADPWQERVPNGGRINMGAYGMTASASMSEGAIPGDINLDGRVDMTDFAIMADTWLYTAPWAK